LASLSTVSSLTGGDILYLGGYNPKLHSEKLYYEVFRNITKARGTEVMIKARCSTGFSVVEYFGGFGYRESVDLQLPSIDADKTFGITLRNDTSFVDG
jgi:protein transport protein SEC24